MITKLILEFNNEQQVKTLLEFLKLIDVKFRQEQTSSEKEEMNQTMQFYNQFNYDLSQFKFDRDEANER